MFDRFAGWVSRALAQPAAFLAALGSIVLWAATGPVFGYSDQWQLVVNTGTTVVTFLMVFVLQNSTARENAAIEAKLDELIRAAPEARDELMGAEEMLADEIAALRQGSEIAGRFARANDVRPRTQARDDTRT